MAGGVSGGWLATVPDVVAGLADAHALTVLDLPRDPAVLDAVGLLVDAVVVVVGTQVPQLAAACRRRVGRARTAPRSSR